MMVVTRSGRAMRRCRATAIHAHWSRQIRARPLAASPMETVHTTRALFYVSDCEPMSLSRDMSPYPPAAEDSARAPPCGPDHTISAGYARLGVQDTWDDVWARLGVRIWPSAACALHAEPCPFPASSLRCVSAEGMVRWTSARLAGLPRLGVWD
jgi:hypothetical protein